MYTSLWWVFIGEDEPNLTFAYFSDGLKLNHQPVFPGLYVDTFIGKLPRRFSGPKMMVTLEKVTGPLQNGNNFGIYVDISPLRIDSKDPFFKGESVIG